MDAAYVKALAALQPFIHLSSSTKNPSHRFLADLIVRATSAPGTYVFTELLQVPSIQSLRAADTPAEYRAYLTLLETFSWGTYEEYNNGLPRLSEAQTQKLQQLSLLTIASPFSPTNTSDNVLTYSSLISALSLPDQTALESLVTTCIYSNLLTARLSPTSTPPTVHIAAVAPLRDLRPQSLPALLQIFSTWSSRCDSVVAMLEGSINSIKASAVTRNTLAHKRQEIIDDAVLNIHPANDEKDTDNKKSKSKLSGNPISRLGSKRDLDDEADDNSDDMDIDEGIGEMGSGFTSNSGGVPTSGIMLGGGATRGTKRNRGRG